MHSPSNNNCPMNADPRNESCSCDEDRRMHGMAELKPHVRRREEAKPGRHVMLDNLAAGMTQQEFMYLCSQRPDLVEGLHL